MKVAWDVAFMVPMLEMACPKQSGGKNHSAFTEEILYLYRYNNPLSDFRMQEARQLEIDRYIRTLPPYQPLDGLSAKATKKPVEKKDSICEFAIVIPSYNNEKYYKENLDSACWQKSTHPYHIYYVNDASTDATGKCVEEYVKQNHLEDKVTIIHNDINLGPGANTYNTIHNHIADHKIVVVLDGDDLFPHNDVLLTLEKHYSDPDTWMTYGVLETLQDKILMGEKIPDGIFTSNSIRSQAWMCALRTFKAGLFKKILKDDFMYEGTFMKVTADLAFMLAMLEMSAPKNGVGKNHCKFIDEILYLYRDNTPINDFRIN